MPKVSIIIPVFNTAKFLESCVKSCLNQSERDIEVILIDDKSSDCSLKIAESFLNDKRVKIIQNPQNLGTFLTRKRGIEAACGDYVIFLDSDDKLRSDCVEILFQKITTANAKNVADSTNFSQKSYDIIHFGIIHEPVQNLASLPKIYTQNLSGEAIVREIVLRDFGKSWLNLAGRMYQTKLVKNALNKLDSINSHLIASEDTLLFFVILLLAKNSVGVGENLYIYRHNTTSTTRSVSKTQLLKQINDREFIKNAILNLRDKDLEANRYFHASRDKIISMLNYFICFSKRFLDSNDLNDRITPYVKYSLLCMKYMPRWQILAKLAVFFISFGRKKM